MTHLLIRDHDGRVTTHLRYSAACDAAFMEHDLKERFPQRFTEGQDQIEVAEDPACLYCGKPIAGLLAMCDEPACITQDIADTAAMERAIELAGDGK
jgi:hypothetical protein